MNRPILLSRCFCSRPASPPWRVITSPTRRGIATPCTDSRGPQALPAEADPVWWGVVVNKCMFPDAIKLSAARVYSPPETLHDFGARVAATLAVLRQFDPMFGSFLLLHRDGLRIVDPEFRHLRAADCSFSDGDWAPGRLRGCCRRWHIVAAYQECHRIQRNAVCAIRERAAGGTGRERDHAELSRRSGAF